VAEKQVPLSIHPTVFLLVYGYDNDQRKGALGRKLDALRADLGHRMIAKGNPGAFHLERDISRCESAAER
jgi:hypothetical protein